ncbi:MAG TPA: serine/threonine-protein kinase [Terriglobales bacterium]|nr:serine/threonine-protein kinase [Terriglobales bacterium]
MSTKIGRFEIVSELAKSASGAVYKANDPTAGRAVALKTIRLDLPPDLARILVELILKEADGTKVLNSQNIAQLYGAGDMDGQFCAAMEYVEGNSLANMIARQEGFSIWDLLDISRQVCLALDHADSHGVLHRGLEPAKVMMQWDGTVKVLCYGLSTMVSAMPRKGTNIPPLFYYMSPEQVKGEVMDIRSNIFSWGAILYEMVTERKPFVGDDVQTVRQKILEETPEPPAAINPRMNLGVSRVIMQALAKSPEERFQRGQELVIDLEKAKETTQAKAAKQASQPPRGLVVPEKIKAVAHSKFIGAATSDSEVPVVSENDEAPEILSAAGTEITTSPKKAAAAAAGAASGKSFSTSKPAPQYSQPHSSSPKSPASGITRSQTKISAAAAPPPVTGEPKFRTDPMMAEPGQNATKAVSFSDLEELPPLKEVYVAPPEPPAPPAPLEEELPATPTFSLKPRVLKEEKPKVITRANARKAVKEIKQVPPQLMVYAVSAAVAIIVALVIGIAYHIYHQNSDEDNTAAATPPPAAVEEPVRQQPAPVQPVVTEPEPTQTPEVAVTPKYVPRKVKTPARPVIIPGELAVNSAPEGAQIQIDGRSEPSWITPYRVTGLNPGQHSITISKVGYGSETRTLDVTSASKSFLVVHLTQLGATVAVTSEPAGASIYIDGKDTGRVTPAQIVVTQKGTHTLLVRKQGYLDETTSADLVLGQTFRFSPILKVLGITDEIKIGGKFKKLFGGESTAGMGKVVVKTQPKGAQVTVNRRMVDKPTPLDFYLNPGNYIIDVTLSGYKPIHRVINVERGSKVEFNENLEPQ